MSDRTEIMNYLERQLENALEQLPAPCKHGLEPGHCIYCDPLNALPFGSSEGVAQ